LQSLPGDRVALTKRHGRNARATTCEKATGGTPVPLQATSKGSGGTPGATTCEKATGGTPVPLQATSKGSGGDAGATAREKATGGTPVPLQATSKGSGGTPRATTCEKATGETPVPLQSLYWGFFAASCLASDSGSVAGRSQAKLRQTYAAAFPPIMRSVFVKGLNSSSVAPSFPQSVRRITVPG
jgi:hypothetical protein